MTGLIYVSAQDCHLCEHGREVLDALGIERREIAADSDESVVLAANGIPLSFLPVLTDGDRVLAYGRPAPARLGNERRRVDACAGSARLPDHDPVDR